MSTHIYSISYNRRNIDTFVFSFCHAYEIYYTYALYLDYVHRHTSCMVISVIHQLLSCTDLLHRHAAHEAIQHVPKESASTLFKTPLWPDPSLDAYCIFSSVTPRLALPIFSHVCICVKNTLFIPPPHPPQKKRGGGCLSPPKDFSRQSQPPISTQRCTSMSGLETIETKIKHFFCSPESWVIPPI
jgi:hypothetical protein